MIGACQEARRAPTLMTCLLFGLYLPWLGLLFTFLWNPYSQIPALFFFQKGCYEFTWHSSMIENMYHWASFLVVVTPPSPPWWMKISRLPTSYLSHFHLWSARPEKSHINSSIKYQSSGAPGFLHHNSGWKVHLYLVILGYGFSMKYRHVVTPVAYNHSGRYITTQHVSSK